MLKKKRQITLEKLHLTNPQKEGILQLLASQKNKYRKLLHEAHERMHIIADLSSSLEFWLNVNGKYEHVSPSCGRITGYDASEFLRGTVSLDKLIHPDCLRQFERDRKHAMLAKPGSDVEYKFIRKDGAVRWARASWKPVLTRRGRHIGVRISITDITAEKEFACETGRLSSIVEALTADGGTALAELDGFGVVTSWPDTAVSLTGLRRTAAVNTSLAEHIAEKDAIERAVESLRKGETAKFPIENGHFLPPARSTGAFSLTLLSHADPSGEIRGITCIIRREGERRH
ncbi:MAG: PAS domain-containing protein [Bacteroidota bacterium]|nr:PAS domain-containing protein [Bacteroidota bacterium]